MSAVVITTSDRLEERGVERGSARRSSLNERRERAVINQTNVGTVSKATLGKLLKNGVKSEQCGLLPSAQIPSGNLNELNWKHLDSPASADIVRVLGGKKF